MKTTTHRLRTLFVLAVVGASLVLVAPTPASAAATTITWEGPIGNGSPVTYEPIIFEAQVTPAGATSRVVLQRQVGNAWKDQDGWRPLPDGSVEVAWGTIERGTYNLRLRSLHGSVVSDPIQIVVKPHPTVIDATVHPWQNVVAGQRVTVAGTVTEPGATPRVVVQRKVNGTWSDRDGGPVDASGHFSIGITPSQAGHYELRVRSNGGSRWSFYPIELDVAPRPIAMPVRS